MLNHSNQSLYHGKLISSHCNCKVIPICHHELPIYSLMPHYWIIFISMSSLYWAIKFKGLEPRGDLQVSPWCSDKHTWFKASDARLISWREWRKASVSLPQYLLSPSSESLLVGVSLCVVWSLQWLKAVFVYLYWLWPNTCLITFSMFCTESLFECWILTDLEN